MKNLNDSEKLIILAIILNVIAIVASLTILKNSGLLFAFYLFSFIIEAFFYLKSKPKINRASLLTAGLFLVILTLPLIRNLIYGTNTDIYDIVSIPIKILNFLIFYDFYKANKNVDCNTVKKFAKIIIFIGVLSCVYNYLFCIDDILKIITANSTYQIDIKSFFHNRNTFGEFMYYSLISTYLYFGKDKSKIKNLLILLFTVTALLTLSRSAIFSVLTLLAFMSFRGIGFKKYILLAFTILGIVAVLSSPLMQKVENLVIRKDNFSTGRNKLWEYGINEFKRSPLVGSGFYTSIKHANEQGAAHNQYHSFFIDSLAGYGIIGTAFLIIFLGRLFYRNIVGLNNEQGKYNRKIMVAIYLALIVKMAIESVSFFSVGYSDIMTMTMFIVIPQIINNANRKLPTYEKHA